MMLPLDYYWLRDKIAVISHDEDISLSGWINRVSCYSIWLPQTSTAIVDTVWSLPVVTDVWVTSSDKFELKDIDDNRLVSREFSLDTVFYHGVLQA